MPDPEDAREAEAAEQRSAPSVLNAQNKAEIVEAAIQVAIRRGEFDDLPGAGKPIEGLGTHHDPDWWIRRKIETENLTGLGPPAIMLRNEDRGLEGELDRLSREQDVREVLEDFNRRVVDARRQLLGGPPVVTKTRDVEAEVRAWRDRRRGPAADDAASTEPDAADRDAAERAHAERRRWWRRA